MSSNLIISGLLASCATAGAGYYHFINKNKEQKAPKILSTIAAIASIAFFAHQAFNDYQQNKQNTSDPNLHEALSLDFGSTNPIEEDPTNLSRQDSINKCKEFLEITTESIKNCPSTLKIWEAVKNEGAFKITCDNPEKAPFGAHSNPATRVIYMGEIGSNPRIGSIPHFLHAQMFEIINLSQLKTFWALQNKACEISPDEYADQVERYEFQTMLEYNKVARECLHSGHWRSAALDAETGDYGEWAAYHKENGHTQRIIDRWHLWCKDDL